MLQNFLHFTHTNYDVHVLTFCCSSCGRLSGWLRSWLDKVTRERNFFNFTKSLRRGSPRRHGRNWKNRELWPSVSWMTINKCGMPLLLSGGKKSWSILTHRWAWVGGCSDLCHPSDLYRDDVEMLDIVPERKKSICNHSFGIVAYWTSLNLMFSIQRSWLDLK